MSKTREQLIKQITADVKKFTQDVDDNLITAMVKTYTLVLNKPNAQLVACTDESELNTVKKNFLQKKLGLDMSDEEMNEVLAKTCATMKSSKRKNRVVFYYLVVKETKMESVFV